MNILRRGPRHCRTCGDAFIRVEYRDGFRPSDGSAIIRSWERCPRNGELAPDLFESRFRDRGDCYPENPMACAIERSAYAAHRPPACAHHSVTEWGENCYAKDGTPITLNRKRVVAA